ncbi:MAG: cytochrome c3 family protein [Myxococcota bacterium]
METSRGRARAIGLVSVSLLAILGVTGVALERLRTPRRVPQPVAFDHALHIEAEQMECVECHHGAEEEVHAGLPDIRECFECHENPKSEHPDEEVIREYARRRVQIPFAPVNRNVGHVYFSHRVHVGLAKMECQECHGDVATLRGPVDVPTPENHSMDSCMDCHRREQASLECAACHK